jgi:2-polyprenyl-3-methyl-5-hydroxy-6-metoxy-1,4-benzoquinol methylase
MEKVKCPSCRKDRTIPYLRTSEFNYVRCKNCGLVYQDPSPSFKDLKTKVYIEKYFEYELRNEANFVNLMELNLRDLGFRELTALWGKKRKFLDIGCATGLLLHKMNRAGWIVEGVELTKRSAEYAKKKYKVKVHNKTVERAHFSSGAFEAIHLSHVIEHVPDPRATLKEIFRILKPCGYFVIVTPNVNSFQAKLFGKKWRSAHKDHLTLFSSKTLGSILTETGFKVVKQFSYGGIAKGLAPSFIKSPVDRLARMLNWGDVTAFLCTK